MAFIIHLSGAMVLLLLVIYFQVVRIEDYTEKKIDIPLKIPNDVLVSNNFPNPFNNQTRLEFTLDKATFVNIEIYDILGRKVENLISENMEKGEHYLSWTPKTESSGIYFSKFKLDNKSFVKKMILLK